MGIPDAGHPARRAAARALGLTLGLAAVRAGSPWQDDPYRGAVSCTLFLALPLSAVLRDQVLAVLGLPAPLGTPGQLAQLVVVGAVLAAAVAFAIGVSLRPAGS
ncbi:MULTISPECIES: hypothetical protein [unclassified Pseudonocardia]|jgi:hypothetical protein|uniref:hypothetical protein n=1 Tax=unclassified Pseudonocardia TaxID=2619320 RepID=UPI00095D6D2A|nr:MULTISPECIES: hypothetical protein [unclassified Pseudonocardia]MBN9100663.1 hypothetical protein [Pseudonocardia sp.]OJY47699.1 MAG: hypothetical protein BGP03_33830 [Pseudonocardia sp. 73-21]